ncbi:MAG: hypothetical protein NWE98_09125 [Candidatus Bathyarchaeota archaeon]|nr:hypothetical protein [Candidatus Bathyarchaeota archaeon]
MPFRDKEEYAKYQRDYRWKRMNEGLCYLCGHPKGESKSKWMCTDCLKKVNQRSQEWTKRIKKEVITAYGGKCVCCGETSLGFLTIDHINNDGSIHRRKMGRRDWGGKILYQWLRKQNYPTGFQVMCFNCNLGRSINKGVCPHKEMQYEF